MSNEKTIPSPSFEKSAGKYLSDTQLRRNIGHATQTIRGKRDLVTEELEDWEELREAGRLIKERVMNNLDHYLLQLEESVTKAGGIVHWAADADEANRIVTKL